METKPTAAKEEVNHARDQAIAQLESIVAMVAALECDYDRLEELRDEKENWLDENPGSFLEPDDPRNTGRWSLACPDEAEELAELEAAAGDCEDRDDAAQRIQDDPLSVQVRSGWYSPGETPEAEEFEILLCTGGPAVRILGELGEYNEPSRAWIQYQDWGTSWTDYCPPSGLLDTLLTYCQQFYFGE